MTKKEKKNREGARTEKRASLRRRKYTEKIRTFKRNQGGETKPRRRVELGYRKYIKLEIQCASRPSF